VSGSARADERAEGGRPVGRPRDPEVDEAVLDAAFQLLVDLGYESVSIEAIAQAAGVSKNAIYRRWPDKAAVVLDAVRHGAGHPAQVLTDTGDIRVDMTALLSSMAARARDVDGRLVTELAADITRHPELADAIRERVLRPQREMLAARVRRAVESGQLPPDTDAELLVALGPALLHHRLIVDGVPPDQDYVERIVAQFWR
jgi:AcrR family transcriptional regulator